MTDSTDSTDSNPFIQDAVGYRDAMIASLQRRLFGPTRHNEGWITQSSSQRVHDGISIATPVRPTGPFVNAVGQEVLAVSPRGLYLCGVLWGAHEAIESDDLDQAGDDLDDDGPQPASERKTRKAAKGSPAIGEIGARDVGETDVDDEDLPDDIDRLGRRRSMAISFRLPEGTTEAAIRVTFGTYGHMRAQFGGVDQTLWERTAHDVSFALTGATVPHTTLSSGHHQLGIGWRQRSDADDGSRLVTIWFSNETGPELVSEAIQGAMFQFEADVLVADLVPYVRNRPVSDPLDLLYRDELDLAVGHGTDVTVAPTEQGWLIRSAAIPVAQVPAMTPDITDDDGTSLRVGMTDLGHFNDAAVSAIDRLIISYERWINLRRSELDDLDEEFRNLGQLNLEQCTAFLRDIKSGWKLAQTDPEVRRCLADASSAMQQQRVGATAARREVTHDGQRLVVAGSHPHLGPTTASFWRPFQIAFVLASLPKIVDLEHPGRSNVDVIWMPTGGGKTEAYLGLAAFTILWERRQLTLQGSSARKAQMRVLMRYTLRLLTVQQFLRSAALICALELLRRDHPDRYGEGEVRIGTWVGRSTTPNKREQAVKQLRDAVNYSRSVDFLLSQCPWCGATMGHPLDKRIVGYSTVKVGNTNQKRVLASCPDVTCPFTHREERIDAVTLDRGLPVFEVDEDLYKAPPDFVIGTIDKVAMMWDQIDAQRLFGLRSGKRVPETRPPALFVQDELHLISGPLGSLNGAIEMMLEELCTADGGIAPLIVASTATTRNFVRQIDALYTRTAALVPPPGLDIADSYFSVRDAEQPPRVYVGVCSSGGFTNTTAQLAVVSTLAHFPPVIGDRMAPGTSATVDPYWTNVCFFSSRAALGSLTSLAENELKSALDLIRRASGASSGPVADGTERRPRRYVASPREITATSSENVTVVLDDLSIPFDQQDCIDLCFATSMIEVGLDVPRLGLMTVIGQPKASSQYIQVTGRVGRSRHAPALVIDVLGTRTPRDRSHYEHFGSFHRRLYASVEGASVTPFTEAALDRTASTVAAILCRALGRGETVAEQIADYWPRLTELFRARAHHVGGQRGEHNVRRALADLFSRSQKPNVPAMVWADRNELKSSFLAAFGDPMPPERPADFWRVLTSTRSVDPDSIAILHDPGITARTPATDTASEAEEELL